VEDVIGCRIDGERALKEWILSEVCVDVADVGRLLGLADGVQQRGGGRREEGNGGGGRGAGDAAGRLLPAGAGAGRF